MEQKLVATQAGAHKGEKTRGGIGPNIVRALCGSGALAGRASGPPTADSRPRGQDARAPFHARAYSPPVGDERDRREPWVCRGPAARARTHGYWPQSPPPGAQCKRLPPARRRVTPVGVVAERPRHRAPPTPQEVLTLPHHPHAGGMPITAKHQRMPEACQRVAGGRSEAQTTGSRPKTARPLTRGRTNQPAGTPALPGPHPHAHSAGTAARRTRPNGTGAPPRRFHHQPAGTGALAGRRRDSRPFNTRARPFAPYRGRTRSPPNRGFGAVLRTTPAPTATRGHLINMWTSVVVLFRGVCIQLPFLQDGRSRGPDRRAVGFVGALFEGEAATCRWARPSVAVVA